MGVKIMTLKCVTGWLRKTTSVTVLECYICVTVNECVWQIGDKLAVLIFAWLHEL